MASGGRSHQSQARLNTAVNAVIFLTNIPREIVNSVAHGMINEGKELNSKLLLQECWELEVENNTVVHNNPHQTFLNGAVQPLSLQHFSSDPPHGPAHGFDASTSLSLPVISNTQNRPERQGPRFASPSIQTNELDIDTDGEDCVDGGSPLLSANFPQDTASCLDQPVAASLTTSHAEQTRQSRTGATNHSPAPDTNGLSQDNSKSPSKNTSVERKLGPNLPTRSDQVNVSLTVGATAFECEVLREENGRKSESSQKSSGDKTFDIQQYLHDGLVLVEKEHELLSNLRKCSQCHVKPRNTTFLPCGHFTTCDACAEPIYECPLCENEILATIPTYLS